MSVWQQSAIRHGFGTCLKHVGAAGGYRAYLTTITTAGALVMAKYEQSGDV